MTSASCFPSVRGSIAFQMSTVRCEVDLQCKCPQFVVSYSFYFLRTTSYIHVQTSSKLHRGCLLVLCGKIDLGKVVFGVLTQSEEFELLTVWFI